MALTRLAFFLSVNFIANTLYDTLVLSLNLFRDPPSPSFWICPCYSTSDNNWHQQFVAPEEVRQERGGEIIKIKFAREISDGMLWNV